MQEKRAFTGRTRRLTNRWSVWFADRVAQFLITTGGIGTIVTVLLVFVFLLYVAIPLFLPAYVAANQLRERSELETPLILGIDEDGIYSWQVLANGQFSLQSLAEDKLIDESTIVNKQRIRACSWTPESPFDTEWTTNIAFGLDDGSLLIGKLIEKEVFKKLDNLPNDILSLTPGSTRVYEKGIIQLTSQGLFRWQTLSANMLPAISLSKNPLIDVDYVGPTRTDPGNVAAITEQGEVIVGEVTIREDLLSGESQASIKPKTIPLPSEYSSTPAWKIRLLGRGDDLLILWKDGRVVRFNDVWGKTPQQAESLTICETGAELTSLLLLQGRYTLLVGDSQGKLSDWFLARDEENTGEPAKLVQGHQLPAMKGAVTSLARSTNMRLFVAGSSTGQVATYHVTTDRQLTTSQPFANQPVESVTIAPHDNKILALSKSQHWEAEFHPRHPEATFAALFFPVRYEGYKNPKNIWQSTSGTTEPEPKFGIMPLLFGTLKATFYSMLFGAPIALLAAVYTSEFVDAQYKAPIKSTIELMATIPSVVLGYLAGMVFAPFAESILTALLASFFTVPFVFLFGAQLWQLLPQKTAIYLSHYRIPFMALALLLGIAGAVCLGPYLESVLFSGDIRKWLAHQTGDAAAQTSEATAGMFVLVLPLCLVGISLLVNFYLNPLMRIRFGSLPRFQFALVNLVKFSLGVLAAVFVAYLIAWVLALVGLDSRGGLFDSYVQRNSLVVGFVMGFAIIPIIYTVSEDALSTVPQHLRSASLGCGATPWQTTWRVVVPTAASGLFSAVMIGFGRAIGETMIMLMATGNVPITELNIFSGFRSLSANIAEEMPEAAQWGTHFRLLFFTGLLLLVLTFCINTLAESVRISFRRRARQL